MKINRENYEAFFLDYHEGQLDPVTAAEVLLFVEKNPDLKSVFDEFVAVPLVPDDKVAFFGKDALKVTDPGSLQPITEQNYIEYLLAETENLLTAKQLAELEAYAASHPDVQRERRLYAHTHLQPDLSFAFNEKDALKHSVIAVGDVNETNFETWLARELESDLSVNEQTDLDLFMRYNPQLQKDRKLYRQTISQPDKSIVFSNKNSLKHAIVPVRRLVYYSLSAAASIAVLAGLFFTFNHTSIPVQNKQQAQTIEKPAVTNPTDEIKVTGSKVENATLAAQRPEKAEHRAGITSLPDISTTLPSDEQIAMNTVVVPVAAAERQDIIRIIPADYSEIVSKQYVDPQFIFIRQSQMFINANYEYYYNLKLADELQFARLNEKDQNPGRKIVDAVADRFGGLLASNSKQQAEKPQVSIWTVAEFGVQTINTLTSSDLELNLKKDDEGKVIAYGLDTQLFGFEKEVKQQETPRK